MANPGIDLRISYIRLKRRLQIFFALWFLAILSAVSLIISSFFVFNNFVLKLWALIIVLMLFTKIAYDTAARMRREYTDFKKETGQTDESLSKLAAQTPPPTQPAPTPKKEEPSPSSERAPNQQVTSGPEQQGPQQSSTQVENQPVNEGAD